MTQLEGLVVQISISLSPMAAQTLDAEGMASNLQRLLQFRLNAFR
jgi:hypothetical protein